MDNASKTVTPVIVRCEAIFDGMQCQQDKNHHRRCGRTLKHSFAGQQWTDAGAERISAERRKERNQNV
jgi:hypothetical protein